MKTFKEFCEQAYNPFSKPKPEHPVAKFAKGVVGGIQQKLTDVNDKLATARIALGIHDLGTNYIQRHGAENDARFRLRGGDSNNPDKMPIVNPKSKIDYSMSMKQATPIPSKPGFGGKPTTEI